jgi:hypothetical protein
MKRAYFIVDKDGQTYNNITEGTVVKVGEVGYIWDIFLVNDGWIIYRDFDNETLDERFIKAEFTTDWAIVENATAKTEFEEAEQEATLTNVELKKMEFGQKVLAYIGVLFNSLTVEDYQTLLMDQEIAMIQKLLQQGALESSLQLLTAYATNAIVTQQIKDQISAKLNYYIAQV